MLAHTDVSTLGALDHVDVAATEAEVLLQAVTALRRADILTDAEYEAKRRRLVARR